MMSHFLENQFFSLSSMLSWSYIGSKQTKIKLAQQLTV